MAECILRWKAYLHATPSFSISCRRRQPSTHEQQSRDLKDLSVSANVAYGEVSANVAYGQVNMESSAPDTYEELDMLAGGGAPVYATVD